MVKPNNNLYSFTCLHLYSKFIFDRLLHGYFRSFDKVIKGSLRILYIDYFFHVFTTFFLARMVLTVRVYSSLDVLKRNVIYFLVCVKVRGSCEREAESDVSRSFLKRIVVW